MTETIEFAGLVLEDQVLDHLATSEGAMALWKEQVSPDLISEGDEGVRAALEFVIGYIDEYRVSPDISIIAGETGYEDFQTPVAPIEWVIDQLRERRARQELKRAVTKITRMAQSPREAVSFGLSEFSRIVSETSTRRNQLSSRDAGVMARYEQESNALVSGVTFGYEELDKAFGGLLDDGLYFIVARPGRYKSWQLIKSAVEALQQGYTSYFATLEMSPNQMTNRMLCMLAGISWNDFVHKRLNTQRKSLLIEAEEWLKEQDSEIIFDQPDEGARTVSHLRHTALERGARVLYIDQLSFLEHRSDYDKKHDQVSSIVYAMKNAASDFPVYCAAQLNREASSIQEMADLQHIGLSDSIGQAADLVLGTYASKEMHNNKILRLGTLKAREFEPVEWEINVQLSEWSNFSVANVI